MKALPIAVVMTLFAFGSALALDKRASSRAQIRDSRAMVVDSDSHNVYFRGRLIGRDPDPVIRQSLRDTYHLNSQH